MARSSICRKSSALATLVLSVSHLLLGPHQHDVGDVRRFLRHGLKRLVRHQAQQGRLIRNRPTRAAGPAPEGSFNSSGAVSFRSISTPA